MNKKAECERSLKAVINLTNEMLKTLNGQLEIDPDDPNPNDPDELMHYFMECYEELNMNLSRAIVTAVKNYK